MISIIVAMSKNRVIGKDNKMPWHLPADLKHFKSVTMNKPMIMGRKTFESIGRALPGRRNLVITRQDITFDGCEMFGSLDAAFDAVADAPEVVVIGGAYVFEQIMSRVSRMYLTYIDLETDGDTFFPVWDEHEWQQVSCEQHAADDVNPYDYRFLVLERK
jgi:dihydrofolate reductase